MHVVMTSETLVHFVPLLLIGAVLDALIEHSLAVKALCCRQFDGEIDQNCTRWVSAPSTIRFVPVI